MRAPNDFQFRSEETEEVNGNGARAVDDKLTNDETPIPNMRKSLKSANRRRAIPGPWPLENVKSRAQKPTPTIDELHYYRSLAAKIVKEHGETYLPIFRRLHEEITRREAENEAIENALRCADSH